VVELRSHLSRFTSHVYILRSNDGSAGLALVPTAELTPVDPSKLTAYQAFGMSAQQVLNAEYRAALQRRVNNYARPDTETYIRELIAQVKDEEVLRVSPMDWGWLAVTQDDDGEATTGWAVYIADPEARHLRFEIADQKWQPRTGLAELL